MTKARVNNINAIRNDIASLLEHVENAGNFPLSVNDYSRNETDIEQATFGGLSS